MAGEVGSGLPCPVFPIGERFRKSSGRFLIGAPEAGSGGLPRPPAPQDTAKDDLGVGMRQGLPHARRPAETDSWTRHKHWVVWALLSESRGQAKQPRRVQPPRGMARRRGSEAQAQARAPAGGTCVHASFPWVRLGPSAVTGTVLKREEFSRLPLVPKRPLCFIQVQSYVGRGVAVAARRFC